MKTLQKLGSAAALIAAFAIAGCGSSDSGADGSSGSAGGLPSSGAPVPAGTGASVSAFFAFLQGLSSTDETSQPYTIPESFAVPDDETNGSTPLG